MVFEKSENHERKKGIVLFINFPIHSIDPERSCMMMDPIVQKVDELFAAGYRWTESVLLSVSESKNIQSELLPKIGSGFCGGISRTQGTCGAVIGAVMALNMFFGRNEPSVPLDQCYPPVQKFVHWFEERFGSTNCTTLIDCDLSTKEGLHKFIQGNILATCKNITSETIGRVLNILDEKI